MTDTLHPNLARIAASYDAIIDRMSRGQINTQQAYAEIGQLEARDDAGIRWSIDPVSGEWVRKTFSGDQEYGTPPDHGYATPDAFAYGPNSGAFNPNAHIAVAAVDPSLTHGPSAMAGATRALPPRQNPAGSGLDGALRGLLSRLEVLTTKAKVIAAGGAVVLMSLVLYSCDDATPAPAPTPASSHTPGKAGTKTPVKKKPATPKPTVRK